MPRELILVPGSLVGGAMPIGPGYQKAHTPADMRRWAADLDRHYRLAELGVRGSRPPEIDRVDRALFDPQHGDRIRGDLLPDGRVVLANGRHRAYYIAERGDTPVPVWVSAPDQRDLDAFAVRCDRTIGRDRPVLANRPHELGRAAPDVRLVGERLEASRERQASRPERG
jgi:hypothetical protein